MRSKFYRMMAFGCALAAFVVSGSIFENLGHHDSYYIIRNPLVIALLLLPFVPAAFLAILSKKRRQQAINLMKPYSQTISKAQWRELKEQE
ncbi:MAG: hypothetical protein H6861_00925 [Rhodospirillales bacterium]|nr:hypothetical protein [Rhodospirillales bacterium]